MASCLNSQIRAMMAMKKVFHSRFSKPTKWESFHTKKASLISPGQIHVIPQASQIPFHNRHENLQSKNRWLTVSKHLPPKIQVISSAIDELGPGGVEAGGGTLTVVKADGGQWNTGGSTDLPDLNFKNVTNLDVKGRIDMQYLKPNKMYTCGFVLDGLSSCTDIGIAVYDPEGIPIASKIYQVVENILTTSVFKTPDNLDGLLTVAISQRDSNKILGRMTIKTFNFTEV